MEDKELIELYKQRNEFAKSGDISQTENITNLINQELPTKITKRGFRDSNGKPVQFEIVGLMSGAKGENLTNGNDNRAKFYINNKGVYARLLIKILR